MKLFKISLIALLAVFFTACEKETADISESTYYVAFDLKGTNPLILTVGDPFVDPGFVATEKGKDVSTTVTTKSDVDGDVMGLYTVEYSAVNSDGLASRAIREVIVCNPKVTTDISGDYIAAAGTHRFYTSTAVNTPFSGPTLKVNITRLAPGFFSVSDFFAGYYAVRAGYGGGYAMAGYIGLNEDNTIDVISSLAKSWGDGLDALRNAKYDPLTGNVYWEADYASAMTFFVTLTK